MPDVTPAPAAPAAPAPTPAAPAAPAVDSGATGSTVPAPAVAPVAPAATPQAPAATGSELPDDVEALKGIIADLRKENGAARTKAKQTAADEARTELAQKIGKALGLVEDDAPADPAALATAAQEAAATARTAQVELAVFKAATTSGANPVALLDRNSFTKAIAGLDPAQADFDTKVTEAITAAVAADPALKAAPAAGSSSVDHAGGSGEKTVRTVKPMTEAVSSTLGF